MKRIMLILAVTFMCAFVICSCSEKKDNGVSDTETAQTTTENEEKTLTVGTPYCNLKVPASFDGNVTWEVKKGENSKVIFKTASDNTELFQILFNEKTESILGTLKLDDKNVVLYAYFPELDTESENYGTYAMYQGGIDTIIENLISDYDFEVNSVVEYDDGKTFEIKNDVVTLKYPLKWQDKVKTDVTEDKVSFEYAADGEKLFDICFSECDGYLLGKYKETPVYIVSYEIDSEKYPESEYYELCAMQDGVNTVIDALSANADFSFNE